MNSIIDIMIPPLVVEYNNPKPPKIIVKMILTPSLLSGALM